MGKLFLQASITSIHIAFSYLHKRCNFVIYPSRKPLKSAEKIAIE